MSEIDWEGYGECPKCGAAASRPCGGLGPHVGRPYVSSSVRTPVLDAVGADLEGIDISKVPGGNTYKALALWLASVIDKRGQDDGPSVTAKLAERLTAVMQALTKKGGDDDDGFESFAEDIGTPSVGD